MAKTTIASYSSTQTRSSSCSRGRNNLTESLLLASAEFDSGVVVGPYRAIDWETREIVEANIFYMHIYTVVLVWKIIFLSIVYVFPE